MLGEKRTLPTSPHQEWDAPYFILLLSFPLCSLTLRPALGRKLVVDGLAQNWWRGVAVAEQKGSSSSYVHLHSTSCWWFAARPWCPYPSMKNFSVEQCHTRFLHDGWQRQCWNFPRTEIWWTDGDPRDTHCLALLTWTQQEGLWRCMEEVGRLFWTIYGDLRESQEPLWEGGGVKRRHSDIKEISRNGVVLKGWGMRQLNKERELVFLSDTR